MARLSTAVLLLLACGSEAVKVRAPVANATVSVVAAEKAEAEKAEMDFEKLKATVTGSKSFQERVANQCQGKDEDCSGKLTDALFCQLLARKHRDMAAEHCDFPQLKFLSEKAKEEGVVKLPSGLMYKVVRKGDGKFHPQVDSPCLCDYSGTLIDGSEFDSSYKRGEPLTFAPNQVIKGWTEALQMMVEGDKWELYVPSDLGYGAQGAGDAIPGDSTLIFTIELHKIQGGKVQAQ